MERKPVVSSNIRSIGYNAETKDLEVEFNIGSVWNYHDVEPEDIDGLMNSPSIGKAFGIIKAKYTGAQVFLNKIITMQEVNERFKMANAINHDFSLADTQFNYDWALIRLVFLSGGEPFSGYLNIADAILTHVDVLLVVQTQWRYLLVEYRNIFFSAGKKHHDLDTFLSSENKELRLLAAQELKNEPKNCERHWTRFYGVPKEKISIEDQVRLVIAQYSIFQISIMVAEFKKRLRSASDLNIQFAFKENVNDYIEEMGRLHKIHADVLARYYSNILSASGNE